MTEKLLLVVCFYSDKRNKTKTIVTEGWTKITNHHQTRKVISIEVYIRVYVEENLKPQKQLLLEDSIVISS